MSTTSNKMDLFDCLCLSLRKKKRIATDFLFSQMAAVFRVVGNENPEEAGKRESRREREKKGRKSMNKEVMD